MRLKGSGFFEAPGLTASYDIDIHTGGVDLSFALGEIRVDVWLRGPIPHPVEGVRLAGWCVSRDGNVILAPKTGTHKLVGGVRILLLACLRDCTGIRLVASAVIVGLSSEKFASFVATGALYIPDLEDVKEYFIWFWLCGTVNVDGASVGWFTRLVHWKSNMAIFLVAKSDHATGSCG